MKQMEIYPALMESIEDEVRQKDESVPLCPPRPVRCRVPMRGGEEWVRAMLPGEGVPGGLRGSALPPPASNRALPKVIDRGTVGVM